MGCKNEGDLPNQRIYTSALTDVAKKRLRKLEQYAQLNRSGRKKVTILSVLGVSKATDYRWGQAYRMSRPVGLEPKSTRPKQLRHPTWREEAAARLLSHPIQLGKKRHYIYAIEARIRLVTIGLNSGTNLERLTENGKIKPAAWYASGGLKLKKPRVLQGHSKRWQAGQKAQQPGELIQIDHMSVCIEPGKVIKHFKAICPIIYIVVCEAYSCATSRVASEFCKTFEASCETKGIGLYVFPPRSPKLKGRVERANRTFRSECYRPYLGKPQLIHLSQALKKYCDFYNTFRPHQSLQGATPWAYYQPLNLENAFVSS